MMKPDLTPRSLGFHFPAEFQKQSAMWLSWPHKEASWPGKLDAIYDPYCEFILQIADHQRVNVNVSDAAMESFALEKITHSKYATKLPAISDVLENIEIYHHPTNDAWCRDHGPAFVINRELSER